ncbi:MAG: NUDIX domain-containing protein [Patescibacteria group bacterium]|nr:NUDIX domain-containing protein [Patescibacteria group bacterium]
MPEKSLWKREYSGGGIVFKKEDDRVYILLAQHSRHHGWSFPKGLIDKGESMKEAALREVKEEGGVEAEIVDDVGESHYFYSQDGQKISKTVKFYLMKYLSGNIADHDWEVENAEWVPVDRVEEKLTFKTDKEIFQQVKKLLE